MVAQLSGEALLTRCEWRSPVFLTEGSFHVRSDANATTPCSSGPATSFDLRLASGCSCQGPSTAAASCRSVSTSSPDCDSFVPLILELDLASLRERDTWLDTELACLLPLRPDVATSVVPLKEKPEAGRAFRDFYDTGYVEPRVRGKYVGRYRKITASEPVTESPGTAECQLVIAGGPNLHDARSFDRFATPDGWSRRPPKGGRLSS